ncbi:MAG TPA: carboxypeptidase regulatory-like domain-containing protein [Methylomirabilota bacterium]|nr:carboxypeptidase regulatory-like domain-containing protein [Methylomirabilota bacterium]
MKPNLAYLNSVLAFAAVVPVATAAEISGKIKLNGTPPPEKTITMDAMCGKLQPKPVTTRHYVVGADKGLANVFVYIKNADLKAPPAGEAQLLDQVGCMYEPYVMGVVTGQKFKIRNSDPLLHNVHATPKPGSGNKEFNFGQPVKGQVNEKQFDAPEVLVRMKCDVHPWMFAYVGVVNHPYFAVTDKDGNFKISGVPAGKYTVEAFHLKAGAKTQEVTVGADEKKALEFTLDVPAAP